MGTPYQIGERTFDVPRLRVGPFRRATTIIRDADPSLVRVPPGTVPGPEKTDDVLRWFEIHCRAIRELLLANHSDLTVAQLEDLIEMDAVEQVFIGVLTAAGKKRSAEGEAPSP